MTEENITIRSANEGDQAESLTTKDFLVVQK